MAYSCYMPYSGSGSGHVWGDSYIIRGAYAPGMTTNYTFSERDDFGSDPAQLEWIRRYTSEYLLVRPYMSCDFYPLTGTDTGSDAWCASQFNRPEEGDGILLIFRRDASPYTSARFRLRGLDSGSYVLRDADDGSEVTLDASELSSPGLAIEIDKPHTAKLLFYHREAPGGANVKAAVLRRR